MSASRPIISAVSIGKNFSRSKHQNVSRNLNDIVRNIICLPPHFDRDDDEFWAVEDISLDINPGDAIGIIGRNGSGKTTLMRMLSGLLAPTRGSVVINGEVQALINLGAGFNQRLSGRENIINGIALRGFSPDKNEELLEKIIDFSEIGSFLESPVATYSSGMKARLGFAQCIFLQPDLIVIDEALSVGDLAFQNKCKLQLQAMKQNGVAMLLVSHSMTSIRQFCDRAIWMHEGDVRGDGPVEDIVNDYMQFMDSQADAKIVIGEREEKKTSSIIEADAAPRLSPRKVTVSKTFSVANGAQPQKAGRNANKSFLAANKDYVWQRPSITHQHVDDLYGGHVRADGVQNFRAVLLVNGVAEESIPANGAFDIEYMFALTRPVKDLNISLVFHTQDGQRLATVSTLNGDLLKHHDNNTVLCRASISDICFSPGPYVVTISIHEGSAYLWRDAIFTFRITPGRYMVWNQISLQYEYEVYTLEGN